MDYVLLLMLAGLALIWLYNHAYIGSVKPPGYYCSGCHGRGRLEDGKRYARNGMWDTVYRKCPSCHGSGRSTPK